MVELHNLRNETRRKKALRVGRGTGAGRGKTCGRGTKGAGARSGYKRRYGTEGGNLPLYRKLPTRGFTRGRFLKRLDSVNLYALDKRFEEGDVVNKETLHAKGLISSSSNGVKVLAQGELTKKLTIELQAASETAKQKIEAAGATFKEVK
jgi:large subunit ribosomal protein L15